MVGKIKENRRQIFYVLASIVVVVIFFFLALYMRKKMSAAAEEKAGVVAVSVARNNIRVVEAEVLEYIKSLERIEKLSAVTKYSGEEITGMLEYMVSSDSIISRAWYCGENGELLVKGNELVSGDSDSLCQILKDSGSVYMKALIGAEEGLGLIRMGVPFFVGDGLKSFIGIDISLKGFHDKIASYTELRTGYITIVSDNNIFVLHPDEKMIGKPVDKKDRDSMLVCLSENESISAEVYSDFLKIDVYRYYNPLIVGDNKWMIMANVPNIGLREYVSRTSNVILFIAVLALFCFVAIILLGIIRWRKEFVQRKEAENANLTLQLRNEQQKKSTIATELENLKSGLNPHFLFNSLSTLKILVNRDSGLAKDFAISLANLYRYLLDHEKENTVSLKTELDFTQDYIYLQKIRFKDSIVVEINVKDEMMDMLVPPVAVQMLVENCIKHNIATVLKPLMINIFVENGNIVVENNYNPRHSIERSTGKGHDNLKLRYSFLTDRKCSFFLDEGKYISSVPLL